MFGLGSDAVNAKDYVTRYRKAIELVGAGRVAFGSDLNGLVRGASPRPGANIYNSAFTMSKTGDKTWDYSRDQMNSMIPSRRSLEKAAAISARSISEGA